MSWSPGFKACSSCTILMPVSDPHSSCLKCLGAAHVWDCCQICKDFTPRIRKERNQAKAFTHGGGPETSVRIQLSALLTSVPPVLLDSQRCSLSPVPKKRRKISKQIAKRGRALAPKCSRTGDKTRVQLKHKLTSSLAQRKPAPLTLTLRQVLSREHPLHLEHHAVLGPS